MARILGLAVLCLLPYNMVTIGSLIVHFYEGERGSSRIVNDGAYPILLVVFGVMTALRSRF